MKLLVFEMFKILHETATEPKFKKTLDSKKLYEPSCRASLDDFRELLLNILALEMTEI